MGNSLRERSAGARGEEIFGLQGVPPRNAGRMPCKTKFVQRRLSHGFSPQTIKKLKFKLNQEIAKFLSFKKASPPCGKLPENTKKRLQKLSEISMLTEKIQSFQHLVEKSFLSFPLSKSDFYINIQKFHKITNFRLKTGRNFRRSQAPCGKRKKLSTGNSSVFLKFPWITG